MKFYHSKLKPDAIFWLGMGFTIAAIMMLITSSEQFIKYTILFLTAMYWVFYFLRKSVYFSISDDILKIHSIPPQSINLNELTNLFYSVGDYVFRGQGKELRIKESQITKKQIKEFENIFEILKEKLAKRETDNNIN